MMYIACVFAQLERETIAERIRDNMYELSKTGRWLGGTTPTGYISEGIEQVSLDGKTRKAFRLKLHAEESQLVIAIFRKYLETGSLTETDAYLIQNHYYTKNKVNFSRYTIKNILTNPVYMIADEDAYRYLTGRNIFLYADYSEFDGSHGVMAYNRTKQISGKAHKERNMEEWVVTVGKHEGIISGKEFVKVQELLERNRSKAYKKPRSNVALLSGLIFCGSCGSHMRPKLTRRYTAEGARGYDYLCSMKEKSKSQCCHTRNLDGNLLDQRICEVLTALPEDDFLFQQEMVQLYQSMLCKAEYPGTEADRYQKLLTENEKEIHTLVKALASTTESTAKPYILKQIEELHRMGELLRGQLEEAKRSTGVSLLSEQELNLVRRAILDYGTALRSSPTEQKRRAINSLVKKVVWDGVKLQLYLKASPLAPLREDSK